MITNIKLEKCVPNTIKFYKTSYSAEDITDQLANPILNCERLDEVLDTSQIVLYNGYENSITPFTRFIITLTDRDKDGNIEDHYIYRYCLKDTVSNAVMGKNPVYRHTITLIEITKLLERTPVDNLCFTNYLDKNYGYDNEIEYITEEESGSGVFGNFSWQNTDYANGSGRFKGPYQPIGTTINTNVLLKVTAKTLVQTAAIGFHTETYNVPRTDYVVYTPSGKMERLTNVSSYTYKELGTYTFKQLYYRNEIGPVYNYYVYDARKVVSWSVKVIEDESKMPKRYTIEDVIDRLLRVCQLRRQGIDDQRFRLDDSLRSYLRTIQSPEFAFTQCTLFEALSTIGSYIHAIPRLVPTISYVDEYDDQGNFIRRKIDNYNYWDTITFTFLGGNDKYNNDIYSLYDAEMDGDEYTKSYVSYVQNATQTNYASNVSVVEPFINGYIATKTESGNFIIENDSVVIKLSQPIQTILEVKAVASDGIAYDITNYVYESAMYNTLPTYSADNPTSTRTKTYALCYKKGGNTITSLSYAPPDEALFDGMVKTTAIRYILLEKTNAVPEKLKDICVQVKYIPIRNFKLKHYKSIVLDEPEEMSLYYNQQANAIDIESFGENIKGALMKTGNLTVAETQYFNDFCDLPQMGQVSNDNYYAFAINEEIRVHAPIKATVQWSKDWNKMNEFVGVKKTVRQYEVSEEESANRNPDYQEFCIVSTEIDVQDTYGIADEKIMATIKGQISHLGFATNNLISQIIAKLSNSTTVEYKQVSYVIAETTAINDDNTETVNHFLLPVSCFPAGNAVVLTFKTDDNFSAGTYSKYINGSRNAEHYVEYGNALGRFKYMALAFGYNNPIPDGFKDFASIKSNGQMLYKFDISSMDDLNADDILVDYRQNPFNVEKDSREAISFTAQLNFVSNKNNIILGKGLAHTMPMVGDVSTGYRFGIFTKKPSKFKSDIDINTFIEHEMPAISAIEDLKTITINSCEALTKGVGYGIIDAENRLCVYVDKVIYPHKFTQPIYLQFRGYR